MGRSGDERFYGLLRVRAEKDGRIVPLWYSVGSEADFTQATVVGGEYTIAFCVVPGARSVEGARDQLKRDLSWFEPLLRGAVPESWFESDERDPDVR